MRRWLSPSVPALALALALASVLALALMAPLARAADAVTDAIQNAYGPYRAALFTTNQKSVPDAQAALERASSAWIALTSQFKSATPAPYDRDKAFADSLQRVQAVYAKAELQVKAGQLPQAHETLEEARDLIADLRQRNGVVVFSDHMNAYHEQMEHMLNGGARPMTQPGAWLLLAGQAGVLDYLAQRLRTQAPAALLAQPEFVSSLDAVLGSAKSLNQAVMRQDEAQLREALARLKGPYSKLFLKFG
jgi:chromosome condensin MukBEF ATPase and DNA-binding subunit MukB